MGSWSLSQANSQFRLRSGERLSSFQGDPVGCLRLPSSREDPQAEAGGPATMGAAERPQDGNTADRLEGVTASLDCLTVKVQKTSGALDAVEGLVGQYFGESMERPYGLRRYRFAVGWESGAVLAWNDGEDYCYLSLNGKSCRMLGTRGMRDFLAALCQVGSWRPTRIDGALDDFTGQYLRMDDVHAAAELGNVVGYRIYDPRRPKKNGQLMGDTAYFGRRGRMGKGSFVRVYDKNLESNGEVKSIRLEVEWTSRNALQVMEVLLGTREGPAGDREWERKLGEMIVGSIDFKDREGGKHKHIEKMRRLRWWQKIVDIAGSLRVLVKRGKSPLDATVLMVNRNWQRTIGLLGLAAERMGYDAEAVMLDWFRKAMIRAKHFRIFAQKEGFDIALLLGIRQLA